MDAGRANHAPQEAQKRVLVVDDNEMIARGLKRLLEHHGYEIALAHTGEDALEAMKTFSPATACIDIGLPDIDGYEVARRAREAFGASLRLIALSGYGQEQDVGQSKEVVFDEHLIKPVGIDDLLSILQQKTSF